MPPPPLPAGGGDPLPAPAPRRYIAAALVDWSLAVLLLVFFSIIAVVAVFLPPVLALGGQPTPDALNALQLELLPQLAQAGIIAMLLAALAVWAIRRNSLRGPPPGMPVAKAYALAVLAGIALQFVAQAVQWWLSQTGSDLVPSNAAPLEAMVRETPWLAWLTIVVLAPLAEELLFRHVLLRRFMLAGRALLGLLLTSLVFAFLHEPVPGEQSTAAWMGSLALYTGMGIAFGTVYLRTGRLGAAFAAHAACNLTALSLMAYATS